MVLLVLSPPSVWAVTVFIKNAVLLLPTVAIITVITAKPVLPALPTAGFAK